MADDTERIIDETHVGADVTDSCYCWRKRTTCNQFVICAIPLFLLLVVAAGMSTLFVLQYNKTGSNNTAEVCHSADCIAAAGNMISSMDLSADPCEDFYQYACGGYVRRNTISAGKNKQTVFDAIGSVVQQDLRVVLEGESSKDETETESKAKSYYKSCMNRELINKKSDELLNKLVTDLGGLYLSSTAPTKKLPKTWTIDDLLKKRNNYSQSGLFSFSADPDDKNVSANILKISQGGLSLSRSFYLNKTVEEDPVLKAYSKMLATFSKLIVGVDNVDDSVVMDVVRFEQKLAGIQQSNAELRDVNKNYNKVDVKWLQSNAGFIQWLQFFNSAFSISNFKIASDEPVLLFATPYLKKLVSLMKSQLSTDTGKKTVQNYIVLLAINDYAPKLGDKFIAAAIEFQLAYSGLQGKPEMWKTCIEDTDSAIGFPLGTMYVKSFFSKNARDKASSTIEHIIDTFQHRVEKNAWMDETTRKKALEKFGLLRHNVGFPDWIDDEAYLSKMYANLSVSTDYIQNLFASYRNDLITMANHLINKTADPKRWDMTPSTVNAYYDPTQNKFVVPAGILRPVIFFQGKGVPDLINFAALGTVTGHEITHGFDDQGAEYDKYGNLDNWWTNKSLAEFNKRTKCLADQYSGYPGKTFKKYSQGVNLNLNGNQTLGENIADNGGIRTSFQAYKAAQQAGQLNVPTLMGLENLNPDQLFFVGYAQVWCSIYTPEALKLQIEENPHSPGPFRVIGPLSNSPDFTEAFKCKAGSNMNPAKKCEVW